ncbi:MAG: hypothetical protein NC416_19385 [Eubacterium sp.]|nr:hypothetical protein [Eubacterium sp.]
MTAEEIMNSGKLYKVMEVTDEQGNFYESLQRMEEYNAAGYTPEGLEKKARILRELFAEVGENAYIQAPYHAMWGGGTKDIPANVFAVGNPARVLREITADDDIYYDHGKLISENLI